MTKFDKKIKKLSKDIDIPESYHKKVDNILQTLEKEEDVPHRKSFRKGVLWAAACLFFVIAFLSLYRFDGEANILDYCREVIMEFLKGDKEDTGEIGVKSKQVHMESSQDLMMELQEVVIDSHKVYALVEITAPKNIKFEEGIGFDYYCFCKGGNYSLNQLLGGSRDCQLLEVDSDKPNVARYLVSQTLEETPEEGSDVTVSFKDMTLNPYSENPQLLVEGMWSLTFPYYLTVRDNVQIEGSPDMVFPYINTTATVKSIELTPLGIVLFSDVSNFPDDERGVSDITIAITLKMIDGEEKVIVSHDPEVDGYVQGGSISFSEVDGKTHQQDDLEFRDMIDINKVVGIYIEDLYVPIG